MKFTAALAAVSLVDNPYALAGLVVVLVWFELRPEGARHARPGEGRRRPPITLARRFRPVENRMADGEGPPMT